MFSQDVFYGIQGCFCCSVKTLLTEMQQHCPEIINAVKQCIEASRVISLGESKQLQLDEKTFSAVPDDSIDYALAEKTRHISVVPCSIGWSDIGSWNALSELIALTKTEIA